MLIVPLQATASQSVAIVLANQNCQIDVYQKSTGLFLNLTVGGQLVIAGVLCEDRNRIVRSAYLGFLGDLAFVDGEGRVDPEYTGLGTRFSLAYLTEAEVAGLP